MDHAVQLEPQNVGVRIPRGAVLLAMAPFVPDGRKQSALKTLPLYWQFTSISPCVM